MNCRSCGAGIRWALTESGKRMPLDLKPVDGGNVQLVHHDGTTTARVVAAKPGVRLYRSHFSSCPNANQHRRK